MVKLWRSEVCPVWWRLCGSSSVMKTVDYEKLLWRNVNVSVHLYCSQPCGGLFQPSQEYNYSTTHDYNEHVTWPTGFSTAVLHFYVWDGHWCRSLRILCSVITCPNLFQKVFVIIQRLTQSGALYTGSHVKYRLNETGLLDKTELYHSIFFFPNFAANSHLHESFFLVTWYVYYIIIIDIAADTAFDFLRFV